MLKRFSKRTIVLCILLLAGAAAFAGWRWLFVDLPGLDALPAQLNTPSVRITDRQGRLLYDAISAEGGRHVVVPLADIPKALRQATIATEDLHFYTNPGVDPVGILRAAWINLSGGETRSGGSTLTQQVARTLLLSAEERGQRSLRRKLREAVLAWQLTAHYSKDDILALYLNQTYYGGMAYGVEAASQTFFGKPVSQLDLAECALLAGLPQTPAAYNPFTDEAAARQRQKVVLGLMESAGQITTEQRRLAENERLVFTSTPYPIRAPHFVMMVRAWVDAHYSTEEIYRLGGLEVRTTLNLDWQSEAEAAIAHQLEDLKNSPDTLGHNVNNAALVALDPRTGQVLALVGSPDYFDAQNAGAINMAVSPRQPGSALKPLVYAAAFDPARPSPWTAATMLLDVRQPFTTHEGQPYLPEDYDRKERGPVLARTALASSLNIPAVLTLQHVGLPGLFELAGRLGISTLHDPDQYDLSLALGGGEVRLLDLAAAYGAFASGGYQVTPSLVLSASDLQGHTLYTAPAMPQERVLDERVAWLISDILSDNDARTTGFGPNSILRLDRPAAVKTGTTSNFHDNWTVGYTPELVVGVWAGNTDYRPMRDVNGLAGAAPIWHQFMRTTLAGRPAQNFARPAGLHQLEVCALSGLLPGPLCPYTRLEWFIDGTQPTRPDNLYRAVTLDSAYGTLAGPATPPERQAPQLALDLPALAQPWARRQGLLLYRDLISASTATGGVAQSLAPEAPLRLVAPAQGSLYRLAASFDPAAQRLRLEAVGAAGVHDVTLYVDGRPLGSSAQAPFTAWWTLALGTHTAWAEGYDAGGQKLLSPTITFEVKAD